MSSFHKPFPAAELDIAAASNRMMGSKTLGKQRLGNR
jgi:hypothetical protein